MATQTGSIDERAPRPEASYKQPATKSDIVATRADLERLRSTLLIAVGGATGTILTAIAIATTVIVRALG